jgi:hypothetical protein
MRWTKSLDPVAAEMQWALIPSEDFDAKGKYTVRVMHRAVNPIEVTRRKVP